MPVPDFSPGEVLTAAAMDSIGMWKIGGGTLTGSAVNFEGVFTSNYNVYKMFFYNVRSATASAEMGLRLLDGSTPASGATDYNVQRLFAQIGSVGGNRISTSYARVTFLVTPANSFTCSEVTIYAPNLPKRTNFIATGGYLDTAPAINIEQNATAHAQNVAYNGVQVINTNTFAEGTVQIYGVRL
jgi:hypothetical protein